MIVSVAPHSEPPDPVVRFSTDPAAQPGNVLPALAALLIGADRRRRERGAADQETQTAIDQGQEGAGDA